jgi:hypothetical protein
MAQPTKYWRLNYTTPVDRDRMLEEGTVLVPTTGIRTPKYDAADCIARRMKKGDGVFLGKLDLDTGQASVEAIGIIQDQAPVTRVRWKRLSKMVYPNQQGGFPPWQAQCFLFNGRRAEVYGFAADFHIHFPEA